MAEGPTIRVFPTAAELVQAAAWEIVGTMNRAIASRGECLVALSGGETPRPVYRMLGSEPYRDLVEWSCVHFFFTDERTVLPENPQSNFGMVRGEFFSRTSIPAENIHRIMGENDPGEAAQEYEKTLIDLFSGRNPGFDLILLGLGDDGHTASLFPGTDAVTAHGSLVQAVYVPILNSWRVTLTLDCINSARKVIFLATGERKASVVKTIVGAAPPSAGLPAAFVKPRDGEVVWMMDEAAAALLKKQ